MFERDSTSGTRPGATGSGPHRSTLRLDHGKKSMAKGHDAVLKALQDGGRKITITLISGETVEGKITGRDKFTVTVLTSVGRREVVYKHAIEKFFGEEPTAPAQVS